MSTIHLLFISPSSVLSVLVFISLPLIWCVGLPCLPSCSLRPQCTLSLSLWKPRVDESASEVCETLIQTPLDHMVSSPPRQECVGNLSNSSASQCQIGFPPTPRSPCPRVHDLWLVWSGRKGWRQKETKEEASLFNYTVGLFNYKVDVETTWCCFCMLIPIWGIYSLLCTHTHTVPPFLSVSHPTNYILLTFTHCWACCVA